MGWLLTAWWWRVKRASQVMNQFRLQCQMSGYASKLSSLADLQHRASPMWKYEGPNDPTRCSPQELDADDLLTRLQRVAKCSSVSEMELPRPYAADYAPPQVCVYVSSPVWVTA